MFIGNNNKRWYGRDGEQKASGAFLMIFCNEKNELRALVRHVRMHQSGHWMMASCKINSDIAKAENDTVSSFDKAQYPTFYRVGDGHYQVSLSGTYGDDGLPIDKTYYPGLWDQLHLVPKELQDEFWKGGGHNSAGAEAQSMFDWANKNINDLRRLRRTGT